MIAEAFRRSLGGEPKVKNKGHKQIEKTNNALTELMIEYVDMDSIHPNTYNPNRQSDHEFELLLKSITEDGFTQPIIVQKASREIVDGYHRWRAANQLGMKQIPVVFVDMNAAQMKIATLRHNRARGTEDIELSANVLRDLEKLGALEWAQDSLSLTDIEVKRLIENISAPDGLAGEEFGQGWRPDAFALPGTGTETENYASDRGQETHAALSQNASDSIKQREDRIAKARTDEEKKFAMRDNDLLRLSLTFAGQERVKVLSNLGKHAAENLIKMIDFSISKGWNLPKEERATLPPRKQVTKNA